MRLSSSGHAVVGRRPELTQTTGVVITSLTGVSLDVLFRITIFLA